jgi:integrase
MGKDMKDQTGLVRRKGSSRYYFRTRIPPDLQGHYGKSEICRSMGTSDRVQALQKVRLEKVKLDQEFAQIRAVLSISPINELSSLEIERLAELHYAQVLEDDEFIRSDGRLTHGDMFNLYGKAVEKFTAEDGQRVARGVSGGDVEMEAFLARQGIKLDLGTELYRKVAYSLAKARRRAGDAVLARHQGAVIDTPAVSPLLLRSIPQSVEGDTLVALFTYWKTQGAKSVRSIQEAEHAISLLAKAAPGVPATGIRKAHIVAYKDQRLAAGKADATVRKEVNLLRAIFQTAVDNAKLPEGATNPVVGVKLPSPQGDEEEKRNPFNPDDLKAIFESEVFTQGVRPKGGGGEAAFWLPLISLWTGARLDEIGQLDLADVKEEQGGWYFHIIHDLAKGRRVKGRKSRRAPVHPILLKCGLFEYIKKTKDAGHAKLFPFLVSRAGLQVTASWSKWFGRYLRRVVKITDTDKVFHSFRHTFKDAWRECLLPEDISDAITGHTNLSIGRTYGGKLYPLQPMHAAMLKFAYERLDLSHCYK